MSNGRVLLLPGSLRAGAHTTRLLRFAEGLLPADLDVEEVDLIRPLPFYNADLDRDDPPPGVVQVRAQVTQAAAIVISTPEYNGSVPGGLKNWVDWITRPFGHHALIGKPIAILGGSPSSKGATNAVAWLSGILGLLGAIVVGEPVTIPDIANAVPEEGAVSDDVERRVTALMDALVLELAR